MKTQITKIVKSVTKQKNQNEVDYLKIIYEDFTYQIVKDVDELNEIFTLYKEHHRINPSATMDKFPTFYKIANWIGKDFTKISNNYNTNDLTKSEIQRIIFNELIF